jgi:hypothetical protein
VGTLILAINFAPVPNKGTLALGLAAIAVAVAIAFVIRQRRAPNPLYDLHVAGRRVFWVAACAGIIVFGSLLGSAFVSQQYLQNVNGYSTLEAGAAFLPAVIFMILVAPRSAKLVETRGATFTLLTGYVSLFLAFAWMFMRCSEGSPLLAGGDGLHAHRNWRGSCRHTGLPLPHGSVPCSARRDGLRHCRRASDPTEEGPRHGRRLSRRANMDWTFGWVARRH